ncbi:MAG: hypothetical protein IID35_00410 [Planctomycetes bacterium]|nr:hypothetical protein [Planctomycetota bacterium]
MKANPFRTAIVGAIAACVLTPAPLNAQQLPWIRYEDDLSTSICGVVNTAYLELVVRNNGSLEIVTDLDALLSHTFVDAEGFVFFDGLLVGVVEFAEDADGFRTLWLLTLSGTVLDIDPITGDPLATNFFPSDFSDVPCDACDFADGPVGCDGDLDGVDDAFDLCPSTPLDVFVDIDGCACFELDLDGDGVDDCDDLCPGSTTAFVDLYGCADSSTGTITVSCGAIGAIMMMLGFCGLSTMRFSRRRL